MNPRNFFAELKRRSVYKVAANAVVGWPQVQVATQVFPFLEIPNCVVRVVIALVVIGFPIALVIVWAFEATPEGIKQTETADGMPAAAGEKKHAWIYIVVTGAAISVALFLFGRYTAGNKTVAAAPNESQTKSIAALPFVNMSADKNDEYLSAGVSEELITALSKITGLQVKARTSSFAFKGKNEDIQKIGELKEGRRALEIDPPSVTARWYSAGHFSTPAGAKKRLSKCPKRWNSTSTWARTFLKRAYLIKGMDRAIEELETARRDGPDDVFVLGLLDYGYAITGRRADAFKVLQSLDEMERRRYVSRATRVYVYAGLGDKAFEWLEKAYQERSDALAWFRQEPESKSLRNDPCFATLMRKIGFTEP